MSFSTYVALMKECTEIGAGREMHARLLKTGRDDSRDTYVGNLLMQMYGNCRSVSDAKAVFNRIAQKNLFSWTIMMGILQRSDGSDLMEVLKLSQQMDSEGIKPDSVTLLALVSACSQLKDVRLAKCIYQRILQSDHRSLEKISNALIRMFGRCGCVDLAREVFQEMPFRSVVSWTSMIAAYASNRDCESALDLFHQMLLLSTEEDQPNAVTFITALDACSSQEQIRQLHALFTISKAASAHHLDDVKVLNSLISSYARVSDLHQARTIFDSLTKKNVVSWTSMITAYAQKNQPREALHLYFLMNLEGAKPNQITLASIIAACAEIADISQARLIHSRVVAEGFFGDGVVANALVNMYGKCGNVEQAKEIFDQLRIKDSIAWNAIISANARTGHAKLALDLFAEMIIEAVQPTQVTSTSILHSCSHAGLLLDGLNFFASMIVDHGIEVEAEHYVGIIDLLTRAGFIHEGHDLIIDNQFQQLQLDDVLLNNNPIAWRTLMSACKVHTHTN